MLDYWLTSDKAKLVIGACNRITHFLLLPPSWLHNSKVKPSKPSVCKTTVFTLISHRINQKQGFIGIKDTNATYLLLQHPPAQFPTHQFHPHFQILPCSPGRTSHQIRAEALMVKKRKWTNLNPHNQTWVPVGSKVGIHSPILTFLLDLRTALTQPEKIKRRSFTSCSSVT